MLKFALCILALSTLLLDKPSYAQSLDYDYSGMVPFQTTTSEGHLGERTIQSVYRNPRNRDTSAVRNGLPPVTTDSFVYEAGGMAELIYGDEGVGSIPPYFDFTPDHRIDAGIAGKRAEGLTTGHGSLLPTTWGGDEFFKPEPLSCSGSPAPLSPLVLPQWIPDLSSPAFP